MANIDTGQQPPSGPPNIVPSNSVPAWINGEDGGKIISDTVEQRNTSLRWLNQNFYEEWSEMYRNVKCRVQPLTDKNGKEVKNRTNICLPDHAVMVRRGTARLTANPPDLRIRGGSNQAQRDKVAALNYYQWDRSREQRVFRQVIHQAKIFGWSVEKTYWDKVQAIRTLRRHTDKLTRSQLVGHMKTAKANPDDIDAIAGGEGDDLDEAEISFAIAEYGDEVALKIPTLKYEGPVGARIFVGDIFPEAGFYSLQQSSFLIENTIRNVQWLKYWTKQKTTNPYTGEEQPVIDPKMADEVLQMTGRTIGHMRAIDLRRQMRLAINQTDPWQDLPYWEHFPGKRFLVDERHLRDDEGNIRIDFIGEERILLGQMWYPWNTDGRYIYNELLLQPDLLGGIGDSTPRQSRYLMQMRNTRMNQTTDFINNKVRPFYKMQDTADITDESFNRFEFGRVLKMKNPNDLQEGMDPMFPPEAWQDQAQLVREMQQVDPATADFAPGAPSVPQAGKLATGLVLQQRSSDVVTNDELNQINLFLQEVLELRMWMTQQAMTEDAKIEAGRYAQIDKLMGWNAPAQADATQPGQPQPAAPPQATGSDEGPLTPGEDVEQEAVEQGQQQGEGPGGYERTEALSLRGEDGESRTLIISPLEIQEDFEILPETGSTLAQDDQFKQQSAQTFFQNAVANPTLFDVRKAAAKYAQTIPGINADDALAPPMPPPQPPPPEVRISFSVSAKFEDLPLDVKQAIIGGAGMPTQGLQEEETLKVPGKLAKAANDVEDLTSPSHTSGIVPPPNGQPKVPTPAGMGAGR